MFLETEIGYKLCHAPSWVVFRKLVVLWKDLDFLSMKLINLVFITPLVPRLYFLKQLSVSKASTLH